MFDDRLGVNQLLEYIFFCKYFNGSENLKYEMVLTCLVQIRNEFFRFSFFFFFGLEKLRDVKIFYKREIKVIVLTVAVRC